MSRSNTLAGKTFVLVFVLSLFVMVSSAVAATAASFLGYERDAEEYLLHQTQVLARHAEDTPDEASMVALLQATPLADTRCTLVATDGTVCYDSLVAASQLENHGSREEILAAKTSGQGVTIRKSETLGQYTIYAAVVLDDGHVLRLADTRTTLASFLSGMLLQLAAALVVLFVLSFLAARRITRMVVNPLQDLDFDAPLENTAYEEIQPLLIRVDNQTRELKRQNEELRRAVTMRREFTGNVSHEMKSPLQVIGGYAELMENGLVEPSDVPRFARLIRTESETMQNLVEDILVLSRLDEGSTSDLEQVDLLHICHCAADRLAPKSDEKGVAILIDSEGDSVIQANARLVEQMVYNLLDNAISFSPESGKVLVNISTDESAITLRVADEGPGVSDEFKERIFERFFRVDVSRSRKTGGTGLGLAIVKHVAELYGGRVRVEDAIPHGAAFVVTFPTAE